MKLGRNGNEELCLPEPKIDNLITNGENMSQPCSWSKFYAADAHFALFSKDGAEKALPDVRFVPSPSDERRLGCEDPTRRAPNCWREIEEKKRVR